MRIEYLDVDRESMEELKSLRISSIDEEEEGVKRDDFMDEFNDDDDDDWDDDDDDDWDDEEELLVNLGFVKKPKNSWSLLRQMFPSKAGGIPAWLDPENLPSGKSCSCDICGEPLQFLLQVYAPISEKDSTFHRTLFVFMCPSMACLLRDQHEQWKHGPEKPSRSVKVFRCQLPHINAFYSREPPKRDGTAMPLGIEAPRCTWCRTWKGDKICNSCRTARYCSKKHQVKHWREGHKLVCQSSSVQSPDANNVDSGASSIGMPKVASKTIWPEYEIKIDESGFSSSDDDEDYNSLVTTQRMDGTAKSKLDTFEGDDDRKNWPAYQKGEEVLRSSRDERAEPLWRGSSGRPSRADIPMCSYCGGAMNFKFQILSQLLFYFGVKDEVDSTSLDWATIVMYTCADSCEGSVSYKEEFAWVQLLS